MNNFIRVVRLSLGFRLTILGIACCSVLVAFFWGANVTAVYPFVEAVFRGDSMPQWVDHQIQATTQRIQKLESDIERLQQERDRAAASEWRNLDVQIGYANSRLGAERKALNGVRRLAPYIHRYLPSDAFRTLIFVVTFIMVSTLLKGIFLTAQTVLVARLSNQLAVRLRRQCYERTLAMDLASFEEGRTGDLMSRFTGDINAISGGIRSMFGVSLLEPLKMLSCMIGAACISWRLLLFSMLVTPLPFILMYRLARSIRRANRRVLEETALFYNRLAQTFTAIQIVKAFVAERWERGRLRAELRRFYRKAMRVATLDSLTRVNTEVLGVGVICLAILAGGYLVLNQETHLLGLKMTNRPLSFGALVMFYGFLIGTSDPARKLSGVVASIQAGAAAADRVYAVLDRKPKIVDPSEPQRLGARKHDIEFRQVHFHYRAGEAVLKGINLTIPFGETLAIVGPNGCGKSTLAKLMLRFYDPTQGSIRLGGVDLRRQRLRGLRSQIGTVTQHTWLFDDTVMNNIRYGRPHATSAEVIAAARRAHADHFITHVLEHGYETPIGEAGGRLSGGQRQRIALARAILCDPAILILDEATSQVDVESEQLTHQALRQFKAGRTIILITHRLTTLSLADRILVMDSGRVSDLGTHDELVTRCGFYRRLYQVSLRTAA
jgi:ATP-binding cassette subfamily B protein/subfamily B ATP-binding cassette protein MsbA